MANDPIIHPDYSTVVMDVDESRGRLGEIVGEACNQETHRRIAVREAEAARVIGQLDDAYMAVAADVARCALARGDAGYGCVIVRANKIVARAGGSETPTDCTCHSEVVAIRAAQGVVGGLLQNCWLYSTFEPCVFCIGAICHSKVSRVIYGAERSDLPELYRQRRHSARDLLADTGSPAHLTWGILREQCIEVTTATPKAPSW